MIDSFDFLKNPVPADIITRETKLYFSEVKTTRP